MTLVLALLIDALFGEPKWFWSRFPHPAVLMGHVVDKLDNALNIGQSRRINGIFALALMVIGAGILGLLLQLFPGQIVDILVLAIFLAQKSLTEHVDRVAAGLRMSLAQARRDVAMIVGRDTADMNEGSVARSAIESAAENFSDGVIAPVLWFLIGGLPGLFIYKITNTADSMIGYRTKKYEEFGWAAARFDDLLNLIPARASACLIWLTAPNRIAITNILAEAPKHRSPNAGWPEAAMAHNLDIALSGPRSYSGEMRAFPYVNASGTYELNATHIDRAVKILWKSWGLAVFAAILIALF